MRLSLTDEKFLGLVWQVLVVGIVAGLVVWLWANALHNLNARRIATGLCHNEFDA
jgi:general L-amino acid transport system permease protein